MIRKNDYTEMEVRVNGDWKKVNVLKTLEDGSCLYIVGEHNSEGTYMSGGCIPAEQYRAIKRTKTVTRVKSEIDLLKLFLDKGYHKTTAGSYTRGGLDCFTIDMWASCGKAQDSFYNYEPEWLEEVEVAI